MAARDVIARKLWEREAPHLHSISTDAWKEWAVGTALADADSILSALKEAGWVVVHQELWETLLNDMADEYMDGPVGLNVVRDP